jgi:hypothetical protein
MVHLNFINPCSDKYHALDDFKNITDCNKAFVILLTIVTTIFTLGFGTTPCFRALVNAFKKVDSDQNSTTQKADNEAKKIITGDSQKGQTSSDTSTDVIDQKQEIQTTAPLKKERNKVIYFGGTPPDSFVKALESKLSQYSNKNVVVWQFVTRMDHYSAPEFKKFQQENKNIIFIVLQEKGEARSTKQDTHSFLQQTVGASLYDDNYPTTTIHGKIISKIDMSGITFNSIKYVENQDEILKHIK